MADDRRRPKDEPELSSAPESRAVTPEEIQDVLADPGYSAGDRKSWLIEALADLQRDGASTHEHQKVINEIKRAIDDNQKDKPVSDDTL